MVDKLDRKFAAGSMHTSKAKLSKLARSSDRVVRKRVATNSATDKALLMELASDQTTEVRREVVFNPNVSYITLVNLSFDKSPDVRYAVAESTRTPMVLLRRMEKEDPNPYVRDRARETLLGLEEYQAEIESDKNIICFMDHLNHIDPCKGI